MHRNFLWLFLAIIATNLGAENFYVSEIFLSSGVAKEHKAQWLELHNTSKRSLIINFIKIEIHAGDHSPRVIEKHIESPVLFEERLIIAHEKDLGLGLCFDEHMTLIALEDFYINKAKNIKICISLNQEQTCFKIAANLFAKKSSFYKSPENIWRSEPCALTKDIYATPGLAERVCLLDSNFALDIIKDCQNPKINPKIINFNAHSYAKPIITSAHMSSTHNLDFKFKDDDLSDLWQLSHCSAPATSMLICHELRAPFSVDTTQENNIKIPEDLKHHKQKLFLTVRDLHGLSDSVEITRDIEGKEITNKSKLLKSKIISTGMNRFSLELHIEATEVPLNAQILSAMGDVLAQRAFVNAGVYRLNFSTKDSLVKLTVLSQTQNILTDLQLKNTPEKSSCATHDSNFLWIIVYLTFIIRRNTSG